MPESEYDVEYFVRAAHDAGQKLRVVSLACSKQERAVCNPRSDRTKGTRGVAQTGRRGPVVWLRQDKGDPWCGSDRTKGTRGVAQTCNIAQTRHVFFHQRFQFVSC